MFTELFYDAHLSYFLLTLIFVLFRIFYAFTVYVNAKRRQLDNPVFWSVFNVAFGLIAFIMFFAVNAGQGIKNKRIPAQTISLTVLLAVSVILTAVYPVFKIYETAMEYRYSQDSYVEKQNIFKYVTYDKMGNEYNVFKLQYGNMIDYGDYYYLDYASSGSGIKYYYENGQEVKNESLVLIGEDGYAVNLDVNYDDLRTFNSGEVYLDVYFDEEGKKYYNPYDCSWDKDGNLYIDGYGDLNDDITLDSTTYDYYD